MQIPIELVTLTAQKPPLQIYRPRQLPSLPRPKFAPAHTRKNTHIHRRMHTYTKRETCLLETSVSVGSLNVTQYTACIRLCADVCVHKSFSCNVCVFKSSHVNYVNFSKTSYSL
jgi:hypothetical protein